MTRLPPILALALVGATLVGCAFDPYRNKRPARLLLGANARHFAAPLRSEVAFRDTTPPAKEMTVPHEAAAATAQFTMGMRHDLYIGGELEAGMLDEPGSSLGAAYGVFGYDHRFAAGSIGAELATGWRSVRYSTDAEDLSKTIVEPRLRAQVWLSEYATLAATGGFTLGDQAVWMAGVSIGLHSSSFGAWAN